MKGDPLDVAGVQFGLNGFFRLLGGHSLRP
jgi:hypothetical protein